MAGKRVSMNKAELRAKMLNKRRELTSLEVIETSKALHNFFIQLPVYCQSRVILSYMPYGHEADVLPLNHEIIKDGKILLLPRVLNITNMEAVQIDSLDSGLKEGPFGIWEPDATHGVTNPQDIDLVLVPGLAFDIKGNRLGHGKGYYDRFLEKCRPQAFFMGIAHSFQVFDSIPSEAYDKRVHGLLTEKGFLLT